MANAALDEPLFYSSHAALLFALNFSSEQYDRPMMNKMASPSVGNGKGLAGLSGAAQAGMIRSEIKSMGKLAEAILIARLAPRHTPCDCRARCCSGRSPNADWIDAISHLSDHVRTTALAGCTSNGIMRREYVIRYFARKDERIGLETLAEKYEIDRHTVSSHSAKVSMLFGGSPARGDKPAVVGLEAAATNAIDAKLREIGMVST